MKAINIHIYRHIMKSKLVMNRKKKMTKQLNQPLSGSVWWEDEEQETVTEDCDDSASEKEKVKSPLDDFLRADTNLRNHYSRLAKALYSIFGQLSCSWYSFIDITAVYEKLPNDKLTLRIFSRPV